MPKGRACFVASNKITWPSALRVRESIPINLYSTVFDRNGIQSVSVLEFSKGNICKSSRLDVSLVGWLWLTRRSSDKMPARKIKILRPWVFFTMTIGMPILLIICINIAIAEPGSGIDYIRNRCYQWLGTTLGSLDLSSAPNWIISSYGYLREVVYPMVCWFLWLCIHLATTKAWYPVWSWSVFLFKIVSTVEISHNDMNWIAGCVCICLLLLPWLYSRYVRPRWGH